MTTPKRSTPMPTRPRHDGVGRGLLVPPQKEAGHPQVDLGEFFPYLLHKFVASWQARFSARIGSMDLSFEQWRTLLVLSQSGPLNIRALSEATLIPYSTLQRWLALMERKQFVRRRATSADARAVEIEITPKGQRTFAEVFPLAMDDCERALRGFSPLEYHALIDFLQRLQRNISSD